MRLSWNEIRSCAAEFSREWADAAYEKGQTQSFYNDFFEILSLFPLPLSLLQKQRTVLTRRLYTKYLMI